MEGRRVVEKADFYDFCFYNRELCQFCWTDWVNGRECRHGGRILVKKDSTVTVLEEMLPSPPCEEEQNCSRSSEQR